MQSAKKKHSLKQTASLFQSFLPYFRPHRGTMALDLFCAALTTICDIVLPLIVRFITGSAQSGTPLLVSAGMKVGALYLVLRVIDTADSSPISAFCV